jgi:selenocysteine lyase/cysteine desulfurase
MNLPGFAGLIEGIIFVNKIGINRIGLHCAPLIHKDIGSLLDGTVRLSRSWFTTKDEVEPTAAAIKMVIRSH